ncbi:PBECR2 nuclease fold domain-containing protein [Helicobacter rappini]|nr:PBECR2 nuclease fold domain-containing protein [Helicobacter rappini]
MPKTREYQVITDKKAFIENLNVLKSVAEPIPPTLDIHAFLKTLDNVENKENFIEHLSTRQDSQARLAYLNLVEPTLKRADIELTFLPNKKEYIKSFKDKDNNLLYLLVTKDNDKTLITGIPNPAERYVRSEINKADIIHSFVPQDRQTTEVVNGLSTQNPTTKQEISKEIESKSTQDNTQWQQFIHNALPNELKHYEKLSGEQLNKIKEANELDKDIFFSRWHNHPKVLETIKVKTKDNKEVEVLKTLHKDGNIKYYEPLSATEVDINKFKDIDLQTYKQSIIENVGENQTKIFDIVAGMNAKYFNTFEKELLNDIFSHHKNKKGMQKIKDIESKSTTQEIIKQAKASGKSVAETKELLQQHKDIESKRKETQKLITQEKEAKEKLHKEIGIFEKEKQNALEKLESIKTQINELEKKDLSSKQAQKQMDKLQTNLSFFANEIEKTRNLIKQRKDKLATTQEVYIPQNHTFSYDGREFNTREHFSILKQRSLNNQDDDFNGFDTLMREAIENALNIKPIKEFGTNYAEHYHSGESAIAKLISEAQAHKESGAKGEYKGQVAGAFHRKELGDIDLVWGEVTDFEKHKGYGLAHILDKRKAEFMQKGFSEAEAEAKAMEFAKNEISDIVQNGKITNKPNEATKIETQDYKLILKQNWSGEPLENKWLVTAYIKNEKGESISSTPFTKGDNLPLNSKDIIPQQTPKETQDSTAQILENFKKEFNIHDKAFKPTGHIRDNTKTGELEVLDTLNEYRPILNKNTYKKDGYYVISNQHNDLELLDFNGFNLGKVYHKKYDGQHRLFNIQDLELLENVSKDFLLLNGNKTLEQAKKLAQSKTKKGVYIDYFNEIQDPIKSINKATTKDGVEVYILNTQKFKQKEPLTNLLASSKQLSQRTSQETKEIILNHILENDRLLYLLKQGINTQHLSPFQKEVLESVLVIANNPTKYKAYKLQELQKQLDKLNESEAYLKTLGNYDKARYAKDRQELEREIAALKGETSLESATQKADSNDIIFTDKKGKEHTLTKEVQEQWCETFNLKSLDEAYTPKHSDEIREALGGKEIKLQLGSLKKLVAQGREKYIPQIKEVLDSPEAILKDSDNAFLFIKHLKDDDYFVNVGVDKGEYLVSISNGIKETNNIKNKLDFGAKVIYQSPNANSNLQTLLQTSQYSANKIDNDIIPQTPQEIIKQAKEQGKSVAETKELLQKNKDNKIINTLKDMQDKDINVKLGDKDLLDLYASASRDIVQNMENASFELDFIHQIKQYNDNLFAFFEKNPQFKELSLFKNFYNHLQNIIRKKQIENFTKPLNSKTEISTKSGNIYYFDEKHNLLKNPQEKPIKKR